MIFREFLPIQEALSWLAIKTCVILMQMSSPDSYKMNEFSRALHFENKNYFKFTLKYFTVNKIHIRCHF